MEKTNNNEETNNNGETNNNEETQPAAIQPVGESDVLQVIIRKTIEEAKNNEGTNNSAETQPAAVLPVGVPVFHAPIVEVMCSFCRKLCFSYDELQTHERTHLENKKLVCRLCKKGFARRSYLSEHMLIHTGECPWKCQYPGCEKTFALRCNLVRHMRVHSGEKPFKCELCDKTFTLKKNMQEHRLTHTKEKPFHCPQCGRKFARRSSLVRHARTHTDSRTFECAHCGKKFPWRYYLQRHLQNKHDDPPKERQVIRKRQRRTKAQIARDKAVKEAAKKKSQEPVTGAAVPIFSGLQIKIEEGEGEGSTTCVFVPNGAHGNYEFEGVEPKEETSLMQIDDDGSPSTSKASSCSATPEKDDPFIEQEMESPFEPVEIKEEFIDVENVTDDEAEPLMEPEMEANHTPVTALATSVIAYASSASKKVIGQSLVSTIVPRTT